MSSVREDVKTKKESLIASGTKSDTGRSLVTSEQLYLCINELSRILNSLGRDLERNELGKEDLNYLKNEMFRFENLAVSDFETSKLNLSATSYRMRLVFENCSFEGVRLIPSANNNFSQYSLVDSDIAVLSMGTLRADELEVDHCVINEIRAKNASVHIAEFKDTRILKNADFTNGKYNKLVFSNCCFGVKADKSIADFSYIKMNGAVRFIDCNFFSVPAFYDAEFHSQVDFYKTTFHNTDDKDTIGSYRYLRKSMQNIGADSDALMFHALKMDARRKLILPNPLHFWDKEWTASVSSHFLKIFNDYGRNYWRPLIWLSLLSFLAFAWYLWSHALACNGMQIGGADVWEKTLCDGVGHKHLTNEIKASIIYSVQRSLGPLGLIVDSGLVSAKTGWAKIVAALQVVLSSVIWYLIIVQMRRQFRL
jgi:uncharacterized protein YjbI with pentapeptide repeats